SPVPFSFFELNVSCPNLLSPVDFYEPAHLSELLTRILSGGLQKPLFIKMPISESDHQTRLMLDVIVRFPVAGIIFGNLQKNRQDPALVPEEVTQAGKGHFSGKPTEQRSNELIALAYREYGHRLTIIGCGGIFSAEDAYKKISAGASLVQLITGMVYEGPQLIGEINSGLVRLLKRDGFVSIREAIGKDSCLPKK
ncbi:MAG TPA: quinone-dependent dihydroorotate dehydrogenase, partial [Patescibacteria group bacterium]|nr:quinone-dependent dihydroorotate dehydrogenase [Patescibacteria group bacterium]